MQISEMLRQRSVWEEYYSYKRRGGNLTPGEDRALREFIDGGAYLPVCDRIDAGAPFSPPRKLLVQKLGNPKKRTVYTFRSEENTVLKLVAHLLIRRYDGAFSDRLYSFRCGHGVRAALDAVRSIPELSGQYVYKADVTNYFNSIPADRLLPLLERTLTDDPVIYALLSRLLTDTSVLQEGELREDPEKGAMAGTPTAVFLANLYLSGLDRQMEEAGIPYFRYSDDILLFAPTQELLTQRAAAVKDYITGAGLSLNPEKEVLTAPGERWSFLGFSYHCGTVDLAPVSIDKIKHKMRRKARALLRWSARKSLPPERAIKAFIRRFNERFFRYDEAHELTWARWYFPLINTDAGLRELDAYMQSCIRYLSTGKHTKANLSFRYERMKELGYINLVNAWYRWRDTGEFPEV